MKITTYASPRDALDQLARRRGESLAELSRMIGRPDGYLARFVRDGVPKQLRPAERALLASYLATDPRDLGE